MDVLKLWRRVRGLRERLRFKYGPQAATLLADISTYQARRALAASGPLAILVDNSVLGNAITHETAWVSTGTKKWGPHDVATGYSARIPVHPADSASVEYEHVKYLTGITHLARRGHLHLKTSAELQDETWRHPMGRFSGYGYFDYSLFNGIKLESVDGIKIPTLGPSYLNLPTPAEQQQARLASSGDALYKALLEKLGQKNSQDAWHIRTAETHGLFCFLTMDFKLRKTFEQLKGTEPFRSLTTRVMTPVELGQHLGIMPLPPHIFSYNDASFFVRSDLSMPGGKRRPLRLYKKSRP